MHDRVSNVQCYYLDLTILIYNFSYSQYFISGSRAIAAGSKDPTNGQVGGRWTCTRTLYYRQHHHLLNSSSSISNDSIILSDNIVISINCFFGALINIIIVIAIIKIVILLIF